MRKGSNFSAQNISKSTSFYDRRDERPKIDPVKGSKELIKGIDRKEGLIYLPISCSSCFLFVQANYTLAQRNISQVTRIMYQ